MSPSLYLHYFGEPTIELDGRRLKTPLRKAEAMLFYVATEGRVPRERLKAIFWGEKGDEQASGNLRNSVYLLKRALPEHFRADRRSVWLEGAFRDVDGVQDIADPDRPIGELFMGEALRGIELPGLPEFDDWLLQTRESIRKKTVHHLRERVTACYERELPELLVESLAALLCFEPFDEDSVLELMEAHCNARRSAEAAALYTTYRDRLRAEIGIAPSGRAVAYFDRLVVTQEVPEGSRPGEFFCCREGEIRRILDVASRCAASSLIVLLTGEAGVGKSALSLRAVELLRKPDTTVFTGHAQAVGEKYPYSAMGTFVADIGKKIRERRVRVDESILSLLSGVFYEFAEFYDAYRIDRRPDETRGVLPIARALATLVQVLAPESRPILLFEDLHWFDPQSMVLLNALLSRLETNVTVCLTSRPEGAAQVVTQMRALRPAVSARFLAVDVLPFTAEDTMRFFRACLPEEIISQRGGDYFVRRSEGMPLLLVEMAKILSENPDADCSDGLRGVIMSRMEEMTPFQRDALRVLSVFGFGATPDDLASVMGADPGELSAALEPMYEKKLVVETRSRDRYTIDFLHANVRECVYDAIPGFRREELHSRIADILFARHSPHVWNPELSANIRYHCASAGRPADVLRQHLREMGFLIAMNHILYPMVRDRLLLSCRVPFSGREETEYAILRVRDLLAELDPATPDYGRMEATYLEIWGGYLINWGEYREGRALINRALGMTADGGYDEIRVHCLEHVGHLFLQTDDAPRLLATGREILHLARGMRADNHVGLALRFIGMSYLISRDFGRAEKIFNRSVEIFEDLAMTGERYTLNTLASVCYIGEMRQWAGDLDAAEACFDRCIRQCLEAGLFWGRSHFHAHAADVAFDKGDWTLVERHIDEGASLFESSKGGHCGSLLYSLKAIVDIRRGDVCEALASLKKGDWLSSIGKKSWCAAQFLAKAWISRTIADDGGVRKPSLSELEGYLDKPAALYAEVAAGLYREIGAEHRAERIRDDFAL